MQSQAKAPKLTCLTARGNIEGFVKFQGTNRDTRKLDYDNRYPSASRNVI